MASSSMALWRLARARSRASRTALFSLARRNEETAFASNTWSPPGSLLLSGISASVCAGSPGLPLSRIPLSRIPLSRTPLALTPLAVWAWTGSPSTRSAQAEASNGAADP